MKVVMMVVGLGVAGCGSEDSGPETALNENPASDLAAEVVRLRVKITVNVPDGQRANLQALIDGKPHEIVDDPRWRAPAPADEFEDEPGEAEQEEAARAASIRPALMEYQRMVAWAPGGVTAGARIQFVDGVTGNVLVEWAAGSGSLCPRNLPAPIEIYDHLILSFIADSDPPWRLGRSDAACRYQDPELDIAWDV